MVNRLVMAGGLSFLLCHNDLNKLRLAFSLVWFSDRTCDLAATVWNVDCDVDFCILDGQIR